MKRGGWLVLAWLVASLTPWGGSAAAQEVSSQLRLELQVARRRPEVPVAPDPKTIERDAEAAVAELQAIRRREALIREALRTPARRPDLSYDVWSGIQARNINEALRRR